MVRVRILDPRIVGREFDFIGFIPSWLSEADPRSAKEQLSTGYAHAGGWQPFDGFRLTKTDALTYPGDPPMRPIAEMHLHDERVLMYPHSWVVIVQPDRSFEACRMD